MPTTPVSPKVVSSAITAAATTLVMYLLGLVHFVAVMPDFVKAALLVLVTAGVTALAGWLARDPLRDLGAQHPAAPAPKRKRTQAGAVDLQYALACLVLALIAVVLVVFLVHLT